MIDHKPFKLKDNAIYITTFVETYLNRDTRITVIDWAELKAGLNRHFYREDRPDVWAKRYYTARAIVKADTVAQEYFKEQAKQQPPSVEELIDPFYMKHGKLIGVTPWMPKTESKQMELEPIPYTPTELTYEPDQGTCPDCRHLENNGRMWCNRYPTSKLIKSVKHWCGEFERKS